MKPASADFRADINGLRAVAVIAVVLFHFRVAGFSGGFVGVDAFFVISGYLMTRIILGPLAQDRFSVFGFYLARARRIFPALAALCALLLLYGWFTLSPMDYKLLAKHAGASLLFFSNQVFWKESGYFDADAHEKWLLHTWSLSVEWQFYLLYPLLVVAAHRLFRRPGGVAGALWAVFLASLAWSAWLAFANPSKAFFLLPTRAWEMLAGGLIYVHQDACNGLARKLRWREPAGLAAILAASLWLKPDTPWPGLAALLPVVGAALLLLDSGGGTRLLGGTALQGIGRWSYSIYLWHWPIVVWLQQSQSRQHGAWIAAGVAASVLLGWLSFRLVENPARRLINRFRLAPALALSAAMVLAPFAVAAALHYQSDRVTALRFKDHPLLADVRALETLQARYFGELYKPLYREGSCFLVPEKSHDSFVPECAGERPRIVLWGDSHAAHLWPGLKAATLPGEAAQWTASGCPPLIGEAFAKRPHCGAINEWVLRKVLETRPQVLILAGAWIKHDEATIRRGLAETLARLGADPAWRPRIVLVGSVPAWRKPLPKLLASDFLGGDERQRSRNDLDPDMARRDALIKELAAGRAEFFSPIAAACDEAGCLRYIEKDGARLPFAFDYGHLIEESSAMVVAALFRQLGESRAPRP
ncbi:MAG: acyltransferase [Zoogloeaceae bacterium]|nr:acyltransferase [Zoogloeaceae bacterium]MCK6382839.1 acyltransferase [Rhodocyclaceae bacterium]